METFYNTIDLKGQDFSVAVRNAKSQDEKILNLFLSHPLQCYTPFEVHSLLFSESTPITSIRRSMTNLEDEGKLEKTGEQKEGGFGKKNYLWRLHTKRTYMDIENELKLRFDTFVFCEANTINDDLERCKKGSIYFHDKKTNLTETSAMILKMQKIMFRILPPTKSEHYKKQFDRMNFIVGMCHNINKNIEKLKEEIK